MLQGEQHTIFIAWHSPSGEATAQWVWGIPYMWCLYLYGEFYLRALKPSMGHRVTINDGYLEWYGFKPICMCVYLVHGSCMQLQMNTNCSPMLWSGWTFNSPAADQYCFECCSSKRHALNSLHWWHMGCDDSVSFACQEPNRSVSSWLCRWLALCCFPRLPLLMFQSSILPWRRERKRLLSPGSCCPY